MTQQNSPIVLNITSQPPKPVFVPDVILVCANCGQTGNPPSCFHGWGNSMLQMEHRGYIEIETIKHRSSYYGI